MSRKGILGHRPHFGLLPEAIFPNSPGVGLTPYLVAGMLFFAGASFFFALAESALFALGKWQAGQLAERFPEKGGAVARLLQEPSELLATIVLGNTLANALVVALGLEQVFNGDWPAVWVIAGLFAVVLIGCEVLPKTLAVRAPEQWALRVARPMAFLHGLARPLQRVVQWFNTLLLEGVLLRAIRPLPVMAEEEYRELLDLACQHGTLAHGEREIIMEIIGLDQKTAAQVMTPRSKMACIPDDLTVEEMVEAARRCHHHRLPMYDGTPDTIAGVLNTKVLLLDPQADLADAIEFPSFVPESMNALQLLKALQRQQRGMAIVMDEFGGTAGLVTMEDILEEVVGEIRTEDDAQGFVMEKLGEGRWRVNGTMGLDDFRREHPALGEVPEVETMGGLLVLQNEVVPAAGESVVYRGLKLTAQLVDDRRVREVLVERLPASKFKLTGG